MEYIFGYTQIDSNLNWSSGARELRYQKKHEHENRIPTNSDSFYTNMISESFFDKNPLSPTDFDQIGSSISSEMSLA